jgi:adenosylcobinamide-GDP ribazoletransferase
VIAAVREASAAVAGALGFLTRVPVGRSERAWTAFARHPAAAVVPGYVVGVLAAVVLVGVSLVLPGVSPAVAAFAYVLAVYALVGINNLDGVADCGDAAVVHGNPERRREVLTDTTTGVGGLAAVALVVAGLALGALAVAGTAPLPALAIVLAAEVGARAGLAGLAGFAEAPHDGLGSAIAEETGPGTLAVAMALAVPAVAWPLATPIGDVPTTEASSVVRDVLGEPEVFAAVGAVAGALAATAVVGAWAHRRLGGANGDVYGAATEVARVAGLHAGVIAWTLW